MTLDNMLPVTAVPSKLAYGEEKKRRKAKERQKREKDREWNQTMGQMRMFFS